MKLYGYALVRKNNTLHRFAFTYNVIEHPGTYENTDEKYFYSNWANVLPKNQIEKVQKDIYCTNIKYLVYLLEDDKSKAMSLMKQTIQAEIDELNKKLTYQQDLLATICGPINQIEDL